MNKRTHTQKRKGDVVDAHFAPLLHETGNSGAAVRLQVSLRRVCCRCDAEIVALFQLLGVNGSVLTEALTHKKIIAKGEEVRVDTHCY